eukprot:snap_masked-scaffold_3-processed-gene-7.12-mRNA-1 protein AED:0.03 eAED:0.03 QI:0/-1/0/1/-1/1/1/0/730
MEKKRYRWNESFPPYEVQKELMNTIYDILEQRKIGILESPTGTGKSLSIISSAFFFLEEIKKTVRDENQYRKSLTFEKLINGKRIHPSRKSDMVFSPYPKPVRKTPRNKTVYDEFAPLDRRQRSISSASSESGLSSLSIFSDHVTENKTQVIYASRTHSQIRQFVEEAKKSEFRNTLSIISLGSRSKLCCNASVSKLQSSFFINDKCSELVDKSKCEYKDNNLIDSFKSYILHNVTDIEDLQEIGSKTKCCAYYSSRSAIENADVVCVPYNMVLHHGTRESLGIRAKNNIFIFDEAHNIVDSITQSYSAILTFSSLEAAGSVLNIYTQKYEKRFNGKSRTQFALFQKIINQLKAAIVDAKKEMTTSFDTGVFLLDTGLDHIDLFQFLDYIETNQVKKKLYGFGKTLELDISTSNPFIEVIRFLECLNLANNLGKILIIKEKKTCRLEFFLLHQADTVKDLIESSRSIILLGGTMQPVNDIIRSLFPSVPATKIVVKSFGHVIPQKSVCCFGITNAPNYSKTALERLGDTCTQKLLSELAKLLAGMVRLCPKKSGAVIFFPSYDFLRKFQKSATPVFYSLGWKGLLLFDRKSHNILSEYASSVQKNNTPSILFSVVNGKLSEGINFRNELCRLVVVVGIPIANVGDVKIQMKMKQSKNVLMETGLKGVNQSIGRAIRHKGDFAAMVLLDSRFGQSGVQKLLPDWIRDSFGLEENGLASLKRLENYFNIFSA